MNGQNEFVRLNARQRAFLRAIEVWDDDPEFFGKLKRKEVRVAGYSPEKTLIMLSELEQAGYLTFILKAPGLKRDPITGAPIDPACFTLSSDAYCYGWEYAVNVVGPVLLQLLGGTAGGLVVWALTRVFG